MYYTTANDFDNEANELGISRRIATVPNDFKIGETRIALAHPSAVQTICKECVGSKLHAKCSTCQGAGFTVEPGIFRIFKPEAVEYVTTGTETAEEIAALEKRGITPVKVERAGQPDLAMISEVTVNNEED